MFPVARAVLLSMREREDFGCAENWLRLRVKPDCCRTPAVVSTLLTPLPVSCPLTTPHHYSCRMLRLLDENGLVHRGDCINCETCYFCFDPAFVWPSLGRADFHST